MIDRPTPSKMALVQICAPAGAIPPVREMPEEPAERGNVIHGYLYAAKSADPKTALEKVPARYREVCQAIDIVGLMKFLGGDYEAEVAFAWDSATDKGRVIGKNLGRNYGELTPTETPVSIDACRFIAHEKRLVIADWKTGASWIEHPSTNPQIRTYALMAARAFGAQIVDVLIVVFDEEGRPIVLRASFDELDLDAIAHEVRSALASVTAAARELAAANGKTEVLLPKATLGEHCRRCPAILNCPAQVVAAQALVAQVDRAETITIEVAAAAWQLIAAVSAAVDKMKKAVRPVIEDAIAAGGPVPLPNGKVIAKISYDVDDIDPLIAFRTAQEKGLSVVPLAKECSISKAGIVRAFGNDEDKAAEFIGQVRDRGGVEKSARSQLKQVNPKGAKRR